MDNPIESKRSVTIEKLGFKWIEPGYWQNELYGVCVVPMSDGRTFTACVSLVPDLSFCLSDKEGNRLRFGRARLAGRAVIHARHKSAH